MSKFEVGDLVRVRRGCFGPNFYAAHGDAFVVMRVLQHNHVDIKSLITGHMVVLGTEYLARFETEKPDE